MPTAEVIDLLAWQSYEPDFRANEFTLGEHMGRLGRLIISEAELRAARGWVRDPPSWAQLALKVPCFLCCTRKFYPKLECASIPFPINLTFDSEGEYSKPPV
jgi:hypothetical protein